MRVQIQISAKADAFVDEWLSQQLGNAPVSKVSEMYPLPVATLAVEKGEIQIGHGLHQFWSAK